MNLVFEPRQFSKSFIPAPFKIAGDKIVWIDRIILPMRSSHLVARLFERQLNLPQLLGSGTLTIRDGLQRSLDAKRCDHAQYFFRYGRIDAYVPKCDACCALTVVDGRIIAQIARRTA